MVNFNIIPHWHQTIIPKFTPLSDFIPKQDVAYRDS